MFNRRQFLAGAGAALLAAPFISVLNGRKASAGNPKIADRVIFFFSPNGTIPQFWRPSGSGAQYSFPPGSILEPLTAHQKDLIVCQGVDFIDVANHEPGMANMLTGGGATTDVGGGASVDQYIASQVGQASQFQSLELGVQTSDWGGNAQTRMSYASPGVFVTPEDNPLNAWTRVFGSLVAPMGGVDKVLARRRSILDLVTSELGDLRSRVGSDDQQKLDQHLDAIRKTEQGLSGTAAVGCMPPAMPPGTDIYDNANFPSIGKSQIDIAVAALACGVTKVASLQFGHTVAPQVLSWDPVDADEGHHDLSHKDDSDTAGTGSFVLCERWFASQFSYLLDSLKATPDPVRGGTLFDSTLVIWSKELGDSRLHVCTSVPFVVSGGANGYLKLGQYLQFNSAPHQQLLTSACAAMGLTNTTFGDATKGTGLLPGLAA